MARWDDDDDWVGEPPEGRYTRDRAKPEYWRTVRLPAIAAVGVAIAILILVVALSLMNTFLMAVLERTREFGVMSAIGATASTVRRLVVLEGIFIAVVSCVVATIPAVLLTAAIINSLFLPVDLPFQISVPGVVIWIMIVILGALLATLAPASQASRLTVREALAYL
jgi:putative ABC transport system permease protein